MSRVDPKKRIVICDLDGTLALGVHREHLIQRSVADRDWDGYFDLAHTDEPNWPVIKTVEALNSIYDVWIVTGRIERTRAVTEDWLYKYQVQYEQMIMRPTDNRVQDDELKIQMVKEAGIYDKILLVLEDRQRVVDAWRKEGFTCLQVAPGNF